MLPFDKGLLLFEHVYKLQLTRLLWLLLYGNKHVPFACLYMCVLISVTQGN